MRIAIIGYSGSGKSTLCRFLGEKYGIPILHFDTVQFLPNWEVRAAAEKEKIVRDFLDKNENWCIDGNYSKIFFAERMEKADFIVVMLLIELMLCGEFGKGLESIRGIQGQI